MAELADWETEGARARPGTPTDRVPAHIALRATTWIGTSLLVVAAFVFVGTAFLAAREDETEAHFAARLVIVVVIGAAVATVGAVALVLRLVAGALVRN